MTAPERIYALAKIASGDWILTANDQSTWRLRHEFIEFTAATGYHWNVYAWTCDESKLPDRWEDWGCWEGHGFFHTRQEAIDFVNEGVAS